MKIISTSPSFAKYSQAPLALLKQNNIELVTISPEVSEAEFIKVAADAEGLIVAFNQINRHVIDHLPNLKIVCKHGVGVDNIDVAYALEKGIKVTNVPNANRHAVADFTFGLILSIARQIPAIDRSVKAQKWNRFFGADVHGKTLGVIGLGHIGQEVAKRAAGFEMKVVAYDPYADKEFVQAHQIELTSVDELLQQSDFVTIHTPLIPQTKDLIDANRLQLMKPTAFLINAARGGIVVESDLLEALKQHTIAGAAIDAFVDEPSQQREMIALDNLIATSHVAGYTPGAIDNLSLTCVKNIIKVLVEQNEPDFLVTP